MQLTPVRHELSQVSAYCESCMAKQGKKLAHSNQLPVLWCPPDCAGSPTPAKAPGIANRFLDMRPTICVGRDASPSEAGKFMKKLCLLLICSIFFIGGVGTAQATSASATMAVSVTVASSISFVIQSDASGLALTNSGTSAVTASFGTMSAYGGTVPTGVTRTVNGTTNWKISTPFDAVIAVANQTSSNYTLTAQLASSDSTNTWQIGATTITSASAATLTSTGTYGTTVFTFSLTIPFTEAAGAISNTINFVATAN